MSDVFYTFPIFSKFWCFSKRKYIPATASVCNAGCYQLLCRNNIENYGTLIMSRVFLQ